VLALLASANEPLILPPLEAIDARIDRSDQAWREWSGNLACDGAYAEAVRRSALALKLLLFTPTGATAAAATTSLPEWIGGGKTYDYRFAWVRDVAYTIKAFLRVGAVEEAKAAFSWLTATIRRHGGVLRTMYSLDGDLAPEEREIELPGYRGSRPVREGNRARGQLQLGVFGDLLETAALFVESGHVLDLVTRRLLAELTDRCADLWRTRGSGIWELEAAEHYTMSKLGCWTALDRAVGLAGSGQIDATHVDRWRRERGPHPRLGRRPLLVRGQAELHPAPWDGAAGRGPAARDPLWFRAPRPAGAHPRGGPAGAVRGAAGVPLLRHGG